MTTRSHPDTTQAAIFCRVFANGQKTLTPALANHISGLEFSLEDKERMHELARKNQEGAASLDELRELDAYLAVGDLLSILQSKARKVFGVKPRKSTSND
jgi:hypothetical protein